MVQSGSYVIDSTEEEKISEIKKDSKIIRFNERVRMIPLGNIRFNPYQPRKEFNRASLFDLACSIKECGVLQPITVRLIKAPDTYELISGERRVRASLLLGLKEIPGIVYVAGDRESAVMALVENLQREGLNYMEEAEGYYKLLVDHQITQEDMAAMVGKSQSNIANKLRLLKLSPQVKRLLHENKLSERHARALLKLNDNESQVKLIREICDKGYSVQETEEKVVWMLGEKKNKMSKKLATLFEENSLFPETQLSGNIPVDHDKDQVPSSLANRLNREKRHPGHAKDIKKFISSVRESIYIMKKSGVEANAAQYDRGEYIEFVIRVPKKDNGIK